MIDAIVYDRIEMKNQLLADSTKKPTAEEALIRCLDFMDFLAAFHPDKSNNTEIEIP